MEKIYAASNLMKDMRIVDLSHTLQDGIPIWPTHSKFMHNVWHSMDYGDEATDFQLIMNEHNGTHVDMPSHYMNKGEKARLTADKVDLNHFMGVYKKIDCSDFEPCQIFTKDDIVSWEEKNGNIAQGDIVLIDFGWSQYWDVRPNDKKFIDQWPGIGESAAKFFMEKNIRLVGVDTLAADVYGATDAPTHNILLGHGIYIAENLNNLGQIPRVGYFICQPLKIKGGSASPIRPMAIF